MNKVSVLLIGGICILLGVASVAVGGVMKQEKLRQESEPLTAAAEVQQEMALSNIAMNDDAQVINGGSRDMWVRAKVEIPYINGEKAFDLVSHSITKEPEGKRMSGFCRMTDIIITVKK